MRILMVSPQFRPLVGGYERAAERLAIGLSHHGHEVTVLAERRRRSWPKREVVDGVTVERWPCWYRPHLHIATSLVGLAWALLSRGHRFEVWHVHQPGRHAALTILIARLIGVPTVLKLTSSKDAGIKGASTAGVFGRVCRSLHRRVDAMIALTRETGQEALDFGVPKHRVVVFGNAVDTRSLCPANESSRLAARQRYGLSSDRSVIFVGRLSPEKNVGCLLRAWAHCLGRLTGNWSLVVVGDGAERSRLEAVSRSLGLVNTVRFAGQVEDPEDIRDWYRASDLFVQSSNFEGLSNTMLEALATGLPIVCTDVSGTTQCVREPDTGLVVPVGDAERLADAIVELANDDARRAQMSQRAAAFVRERYSIDHVCQLHEELYRSLIAQGRRQ